MNYRISEILRASSLSSTMSDLEIDEIAEEIQADFEDFIETEKEKIKDELSVDYSYSLNDKDKKIKNLQEENDTFHTRVKLPYETLEDVMTMEWVKENWEDVKRASKGRSTMKEILKLQEKGKYLEEMQIHSSVEISKVLDENTLKESLKLSHKRIILVGKAASGKDYARKLLEDKGFTYAVSYTTRPPRTGEVNGKDYFFLSEEEFEKLIVEEKFYEHVTFNSWHYGTTKEQFYKDDVFIMTPYGISKIKPEDRKNSIIIFFDIEEEVRKERLSLRSDADTVDRRLAADALDFENFADYDIRITNKDF